MIPQLAPMLAVPARPFDSPDHVFEIKWDGIRALAAIEPSGWRLWGRGRADYTPRYPELETLRTLPPGTLVDGELVAFEGELPRLARLLHRHPLRDPWRIRQARRWCPVRYILFDLLYHAGRCLLREPLATRRQLLEEVCLHWSLPGVLFSPGIVGSGQALYDACVAQGHEGILAKLQQAPYRPGCRSPAWRKIKPCRAPGAARPARAEQRRPSTPPGS